MRRRQAGGTTVLELVTQAGAVPASHSHRNASIVAVLAGRFTSIEGESAVEYRPGSVHFHPPDFEHAIAPHGDRVHALLISLPDAWVRRLPAVGLAQKAVHDVDALLFPALRIHQEIASWSVESVVMVEGLLLEMLGGVAQTCSRRRTRAEPQWMAIVDAMIQSFGGDLPVADLAARAGVDPVHLARTWSRFRNMTIGEAVRRARIERACLRIAEGAPSLADLARETGFSDQTHFTRVFKQMTGVTPGAFRSAFAAVLPAGAGGRRHQERARGGSREECTCTRP